MYSEVRFNSPKLNVRSPAEARRALSAVTPFLPPAFYNRDDDGKALDSMSPFTVTCSYGGIQIVATGEAATNILLGQTIGIQKALLTAFPDGEFQTRFGNMDLEWNPYLIDYVVHDFVVENNASRNRIYTRHKNGDADLDLTKLAAPLFESALERRCHLLGIELPDNKMFGDFEARPAPHACHAGAKPLFAVELRFRTNIRLTGPWYVGRLANKGCGRVIRVSRPERQERHEEAAIAS